MPPVKDLFLSEDLSKPENRINVALSRSQTGAMQDGRPVRKETRFSVSSVR